MLVAALRAIADAIANAGPIAEAPDELGTIERFAREWGLEEKGLANAAVRHRIPRAF